MERVQFQQEQMLAELKDLVQKGLFTQKEVRQIMQKRTTYETALVRRIPKKSDYLRYATYEMSLEALRKKRAERLKLPKGPPSVSDFALVRRQFQIFERALKKFKGDVGLWIQYIQLAKKEGARALVGRITARALQLHPNVPALYVLAASHELEHLSPTAARTLLQRGLRLNADSVEMWREYVRMEMGFVESLRRRWSVLGIDVKGKGKDIGEGENGREAIDPYSGLGEGDENGSSMRMDVDEEEGEDEAARKQIMEGAIVKSVISSAVKAIPRIELFTSLHDLISAYPSPPSLRESLLDHLHAHLRETLPSLPAAIKLSATRHLRPELAGEPLVDALKIANDKLLEAVKRDGGAHPDLADMYADFVEERCRQDVDDSLKAYLITSLHLLIQQHSGPVPPGLLAAHIRLLVSYHATLGSELLPPKVNTPEKILRAARKHTAKAPTSSSVWLARLGAEKQFADGEDTIRTWAEARKHVAGAGTESVWLWGLDPANRPSPSTTEGDVEVGLLEHLLHESQLIKEPAAAGAVHEALLIRYAAASHRALTASLPPAGPRSRLDVDIDIGVDTDDEPAHAQPYSRHGDSLKPCPNERVLDARLARVRRIGTAHVPTARVWAEVFRQEAEWGSGAHPDGTTRSSRVASARPCGAAPAANGRAPSRSGSDSGHDDERVLRTVYEFWREKDGVGATVAWASWLLRSGHGREAVGVVARARSVLGGTDGAEVERRWKTIVDGAGEGESEGPRSTEQEGAGKSAGETEA